MDITELIKDLFRLIGAVIIWISSLGRVSLLEILEENHWAGWIGLLIVVLIIGTLLFLRKT